MPKRRAISWFAAAAVASAAVAASWADLAATWDLLSGRRVTRLTVLALLATICWAGLACLAGGVAGRLAGRRSAPARRPLALLAAGALLVLGLGIARHTTGYRVCCATPGSASAALQNAR